MCDCDGAPRPANPPVRWRAVRLAPGRRVVALPRGLWAAPGGLVLLGDAATVQEILRFGDLDGYKAAAGGESTSQAKTATQPCKTCGPDVTQQVQDATQKTKDQFASWKDGDKLSACMSLESLWPRVGPGSIFQGGSLKYSFEASLAWNIPELMRNSVDYLHNHRGGNSWIKGYQPACATAPGCDDSVLVDGHCYYAGSVNYVIFGVMCRLCHDYLPDVPPVSVEPESGMPVSNPYSADNYSEDSMASLIRGWKSDQNGSGNASMAERWSRAGYEGWPKAKSPVPGDRDEKCPCHCSQPYKGGPFHVDWGSHTF
jgi:hypothetical protein